MRFGVYPCPIKDAASKLSGLCFEDAEIHGCSGWMLHLLLRVMEWKDMLLAMLVPLFCDGLVTDSKVVSSDLQLRDEKVTD